MRRKDAVIKRLLELAAIACVCLSVVALASAVSVAFATLAGMGRVLYDPVCGMAITLGYAAAAIALWWIWGIVQDVRDDYNKKRGRVEKS